MKDQLVVSINSAKALLTSEAKRFEAALHSEPGSGRIRPVEWKPWYAAAIADFERQPKLLAACVQAPDTVLDCLTVAANCGLLPGNAHGQFYLIPRYNGRKKRMECTFIVGYKGMLEMAYRHPRVHKCEAFLVYEGEPFEWEPGAGRLEHKWLRSVVRGDDQIVAAYSRVVLTVPGGTTVDQEPLIWAMTREELLKARERSEGWKSFSKGDIYSTPWQTDFGPMCRKTVIRRHASGGSIPRSADLIMAVAAEADEDLRLAEEMAPISSPVTKAADTVRQALGLHEANAVPVVPAFDLVEEALEFVRGADRAALKAIIVEQFVGDDQDRLRSAIQDREEELGQ